MLLVVAYGRSCHRDMQLQAALHESFQSVTALQTATHRLMTNAHVVYVILVRH